jgi:nitrite reductase/ring-hydroxylating ferredoxin subunit
MRPSSKVTAMNFNTAKFAAIVADAKAKSANNAKWIRAIEKASAAIVAGEVRVHMFGSFALVVNKDGEVYKVNGSCKCKAAQAGHRERYHRAAAKLWERREAATAVESKAERKAPVITQSAAWFGLRDGDAMVVNGWAV